MSNTDYRIGTVMTVNSVRGYTLAVDKISKEKVVLLGTHSDSDGLSVASGQRVYYQYATMREGIMIGAEGWFAESHAPSREESIEELMMPSMYLSPRGEQVVLPVSRPVAVDADDEQVDHGAAENRCYRLGVGSSVGQPYSNRRRTTRHQTPEMWQNYFAAQAE